MQNQIKITVSTKLKKIIEAKAKELGLKPSTYCFNIILETIRKEGGSKVK
ncbi:MAG: hypothetical protein OH338_03765 [Candidatus Parvarchaeota archaeon]|nr:hypothetical protein [Candidatus Parvarchaeum tengchongense]MCW1295972.1 hypothetical protein [Candidatus Parvarchaeum tengchongense]MCW1298824.1 hypothetical protein [Candidatus Parvarchaeum tengchongense]MCW1312516.1 hypothetical protein [Candidatus Parvarchaeum tengchongense]